MILLLFFVDSNLSPKKQPCALPSEAHNWIDGLDCTGVLCKIRGACLFLDGVAREDLRKVGTT